MAGQVGQAKHGEGGGGWLGFPHRLDGSDFHLLVLACGVAGLVSQHYHGQGRGEAEAGGHGHGAFGEFDMTALEQEPSTDRQHKNRARDVTRADGMDELGLGDGIEDHRHEVADFHAHGVGVEMRTHRELHPAIGNQDPQRREIGAHRQRPGGDQMLHLAEPVPSEEEHADERGFQKKGHHAFQRQRRAEHIADIMRVIGPVGAELEFHGDAGGDTHGEIDAE